MGTNFTFNKKTAGRRAAAFGVACLMLSFSTNATRTAEQGISFGAAVDIRHFCQVLLLNNGTIAPSSDNRQLSSKMPGGSFGQAEITTTNASFSLLSVDAPSGFSAAPTGGDTGVNFTASYLTNGATVQGEVPGSTSTRLGRGVTVVDVHLVADRVGSVYPTGSYTAEVTVRCE